MNTSSNISQLQRYQELLNRIPKNKNILDLACGNGWAGQLALVQGANHVRFADARLESFVQPNGYTNYQQQFIDLNFPQSLKPLLLDVEVILYFGHLYHCNNHEEILDALVNSDCKDFFIDTKVGLGTPHIDSDIPKIHWIDELVSDQDDAWHSTDSHVTIGAPNLSWILDYFNRNRLKVKFQKSIDAVNLRDGRAPYPHRIYVFHVTKQ